MRMSQLFLQTLREAPGEAKSPGHQLLLRGGFVRAAGWGNHSFLPLGVMARRKIEALVCQALNAAGGQEIALPVIQPIEVWQGVPDADRLGGRALRFRDRNQHEMALATSHEAALFVAVRGVVQSYRQLPLLLYQAWTGFCDEERTSGGLFGLREARVVDGYSLHADAADPDGFYGRVRAALAGVFERCGVTVVAAAAATDAADTVTAHKVVFPWAAGEERVVQCLACGYAADQAIARTGKEPPSGEAPLPMQDVETPHCKTIAELAHFLNVPASRTAKAVFMVAGFAGGEDRFVFAIVRGDTDLNEAKLRRVLQAEAVGPATEAEIRAAGAEPGYGSPVGLSGVTVVVDELVAQSPNLVAGANRPGYHTLNVNLGRDYQATMVADITLAGDGDRCLECGAAVRVVAGVELAALAGPRCRAGAGRATSATCLDREGRGQPLALGRYRLYTDRLLAAVVESHRDEQGLLWPAAVAPYQVYLMTVGQARPEVVEAAERIYADLTAAGVAVLYDDRDERAGVKFNDADLLGWPLRVTVGERGLAKGVVELKQRGGGEVENVPVNDFSCILSSDSRNPGWLWPVS
ncbi:MAG: proline--tRNA ligase [Chloroflexi bacterium HGW-Chloroflexi-1]|nr:MAG: proline--tRNA ligase [Chloroflexi bacterium HGW-Chloroflexi-1]